MPGRRGPRIRALLLAYVLLGAVICAPAAVQKAPANPSAVAPANRPAPEPQFRYSDGRSPAAASSSPSNPNNAAPRPPEEWNFDGILQRITSYLPEFLAGLLVLVIGAFTAYLLRFFLFRLLPRSGFDHFLERNGLIGKSAPIRDSSALTGEEAITGEPTANISGRNRSPEPYRSYFGRPPARKWRPGESANFISPKYEWRAQKESPSEEDSGLPKESSLLGEDAFDQRLRGSPLRRYPRIEDRDAWGAREPLSESESYSEEQNASDAPLEEEQPHISADARRFLKQEEFDPERQHFEPSSETASEEFSENLPKLRRAEDLYRPGIGTRIVAYSVFWIVIIATLMEACQAAHLYRFAAGLYDVLSYIPHLIAAVIIFVLSILVANWVVDRVVGTEEGAASVAGGAVRAGILTIGGFMALRELQIAPDIVKIAFTLAFGAIAVATALAFGLGSRRVAEQMTSEIYDQNSAKVKEFSKRLGGDNRAA